MRTFGNTDNRQKYCKYFSMSGQDIVNSILEATGVSVEIISLNDTSFFMFKVNSGASACTKILPVIERLEVPPKRVQLTGTGWTKMFVLKNGKYTQDAWSVPIFCTALLLILGGMIALFGLLSKPQAPATTSSAPSSAKPRTFIGRSELGYELWLEDGCVIANGVTEGHLVTLNTDIEGFKKSVKAATGKKCVLLE